MFSPSRRGRREHAAEQNYAVVLMLAVRWVESVTVTLLTVICGPNWTTVVAWLKWVFRPTIETFRLVVLGGASSGETKTMPTGVLVTLK